MEGTNLKRGLLLCVFLSVFFPGLFFAEWQVRVIHVFDGDTLVISDNGRAKIMKLYGIDCPDKQQSFGLEAKGFTSALVAGKQVTVIPVEEGRHIHAKVYVGDECLNERLLKAGYAWHDYRFSSDTVWAKMQQDARSAGEGLWSQENPSPPWKVGDSKYSKTTRRSITIRIGGKHKTDSIQIRQRPPQKKETSSQ